MTAEDDDFLLAPDNPPDPAANAIFGAGAVRGTPSDPVCIVTERINFGRSAPPGDKGAREVGLPNDLVTGDSEPLALFGWINPPSLPAEPDPGDRADAGAAFPLDGPRVWMRTGAPTRAFFAAAAAEGEEELPELPAVMGRERLGNKGGREEEELFMLAAREIAGWSPLNQIQRLNWITLRRRN